MTIADWKIWGICVLLIKVSAECPVCTRLCAGGIAENKADLDGSSLVELPIEL